MRKSARVWWRAGLTVALSGWLGTAASAAPGRLVIAASDYHVGALRQVQLDGGRVAGGTTIHSDAIVRVFPQSRNVYVVNRWGQDNVQIVSADLSQTLSQLSVGRGTNPQDIALVDENTAYLTRLSSRTLRKINPHVLDRRTRQALVLGEIDLGAPTGVDLSDAPDPDSLPEMTYLHRVGNHLLVSLERLDQHGGFAPTGKSLLAVVDIGVDRVERWQLLARPNPVTDFKIGPDGAIYLGEAGRMGRDSAWDGGIERLNSQTFQSEGLVARESSLQGDIVDFEVLGPTQVVAIVASPDTRLVAFNPKSGEVKELAHAASYAFTQLAWDRDRGLLYMTDRTAQQPRIRVFATADLKERSDLFWSLDLPPYQMMLAP